MHDAEPYVARTGDLTVRVRPSYLAGQSEPDAGRWTWAYHVEIENGGGEAVQLLSRHWIITDARGRVEEVRGSGVVGEQPVIPPGSSYSYASGCSLPTASGAMAGAYTMATASGAAFEAAIPAFSLDTPDPRRTMN